MADFFEILLHLTEHTLMDSLNLLPFLFLAYFVIEFIEHKSNEKTFHILKGVGRLGSVPGAFLGIIPQCGFSVAAANLYTGGIITAGTLISVFLSTSDEALILLFANSDFAKYAGYLIIFKIIIGIAFGLIYDLINKNRNNYDCDSELCKNCNCGNGIIKAALKHTISIFIFILAVSFVINFVIEFLGHNLLHTVLLNGSVFQPLLTALAGFIPGCAVSIALSELFMAGQLSFGGILAGLCTNAGMGIIVLLRANHSKKDNIKIMIYMYVVSVISGMIANIII